METPNKHIPNPPPFMYHPELYPELAKNNPEPECQDWEPMQKVNKPRVAKLGFSQSKSAETQQYFTTIDVDKTRIFERERYSDYAYYTIEEHDEMQRGIEIEMADKLDQSKVLSSHDSEIATNYKIY